MGRSERKKKFGERSLTERALIAIALLASLAIITYAERDLHQRSPSEVRGSKLLWRIVCMNALGALTYLRWGRRRGVEI